MRGKKCGFKTYLSLHLDPRLLSPSKSLRFINLLYQTINGGWGYSCLFYYTFSKYGAHSFCSGFLLAAVMFTHTRCHSFLHFWKSDLALVELKFRCQWDGSGLGNFLEQVHVLARSSSWGHSLDHRPLPPSSKLSVVHLSHHSSSVTFLSDHGWERYSAFKGLCDSTGPRPDNPR